MLHQYGSKPNGNMALHGWTFAISGQVVKAVMRMRCDGTCVENLCKHSFPPLKHPFPTNFDNKISRTSSIKTHQFVCESNLLISEMKNCPLLSRKDSLLCLLSPSSLGEVSST